jgi:hypothetical protein
MSGDTLLSRREFTVESALAILAAATITITGCSDSGNSNPTGPTQSGDVQGSVSANHGHVAIVRSAQLVSPTAIAVDIRGQATHPHLIELTASQLTTIGGNGRVSVVSSTDDGHSHTVTFN